MTLDELIRWFETLTPASAGEVSRYYVDDAYFKDPFNEVQSVASIERIYVHMFEQVAEPRFRVTERWQDGASAVLTWDFTFRRGGGKLETIQGMTHLRFAADGRIAWHRDYWDAAEELYEKLPVLGGVLRAIKRRLRAT
jgi:hypothetical protein